MPLLDLFTRNGRCRSRLRGVFYGPPPPDMDARVVARELKYLGLDVREKNRTLYLRHRSTREGDEIHGWRDPVDGDNLDRLRGFLKRLEPNIDLLKEMTVPDSRRPWP